MVACWVGRGVGVEEMEGMVRGKGGMVGKKGGSGGERGWGFGCWCLCVFVGGKIEGGGMICGWWDKGV